MQRSSKGDKDPLAVRLFERLLASTEGSERHGTFYGRIGRVIGVIWGSLWMIMGSGLLHVVGYLPFVDTSLPDLAGTFLESPLKLQAFLGVSAFFVLWGFQHIVRAFFQPGYSITFYSSSDTGG